LKPIVCGLDICGKEWKRKERNDEESGKVCEEEKAGRVFWKDENDGVKYEKEEEWKEWVELGRRKIEQVNEFKYILGLHIQWKNHG
jgi:hypothetical protein